MIRYVKSTDRRVVSEVLFLVALNAYWINLFCFIQYYFSDYFIDVDILSEAKKQTEYFFKWLHMFLFYVFFLGFLIEHV